ncbi:hypothetical protein AB1Y20_014127 [Prymnesium parvum]|uniref:Uncharacterized protein n=1 Tax=Prymnesium parvum TaxID=97485 RepID=A0AB34IHE1_PRYPA
MATVVPLDARRACNALTPPFDTLFLAHESTHIPVTPRTAAPPQAFAQRARYEPATPPANETPRRPRTPLTVAATPQHTAPKPRPPELRRPLCFSRSLASAGGKEAGGRTASAEQAARATRVFAAVARVQRTLYALERWRTLEKPSPLHPAEAMRHRPVKADEAMLHRPVKDDEAMGHLPVEDDETMLCCLKAVDEALAALLARLPGEAAEKENLKPCAQLLPRGEAVGELPRALAGARATAAAVLRRLRNPLAALSLADEAAALEASPRRACASPIHPSPLLCSPTPQNAYVSRSPSPADERLGLLAADVLPDEPQPAKASQCGVPPPPLPPQARQPIAHPAALCRQGAPLALQAATRKSIGSRFDRLVPLSQHTQQRACLRASLQDMSQYCGAPAEVRPRKLSFSDIGGSASLPSVFDPPVDTGRSLFFAPPRSPFRSRQASYLVDESRGACLTPEAASHSRPCSRSSLANVLTGAT